MRNIKKFIYWYIGLVFVVIVVLFFSLNSIVFMDIKANKNPVIYLSKVGGPDVNSINNGFHILPTGDYFLQAYSGNASLAKNLSVGPLFTPAIKGEIVGQKIAKHIARGTDECIFGDIQSLLKGSVLSYECGYPQSISKNTYNKYSVKTSLYDTATTQPVIFKNGIVGLIKSSGGVFLNYIDASSNKLFSLKKYIPSDNIDFYKLGVYNDTIYILNTSSKKLYIFNQPNEKPMVVGLNDKKTAINRFSDFSVNSSGNIIITSPTGSSKNSDSFDKSLVSFYSLRGKSTLFKEFSSDVGVLDSINLSSFYSRDSKGMVSIYDLNKNNLTAVDQIDNTLEAVVINKTLYVLIDGDLYSYNKKERVLNLVFQSKNIKVTRIHNIGNTPVITGVSLNENSPVNQIYVIEKRTQPEDKKRIEDIVPYGDKNSSVGWMDYFDNNIYISVELYSLRKNSIGGGVVFDEQELKEKKQSIEKQLEEGGLNKKYSIIYGYY